MGDSSTISSISTYTTDDQQSIYDYYGLDADGDGKVDPSFDADGDGKVDDAALLGLIASDIESNTTSAAGIEDLISFYIDQTGTLPDILPSPDAYPELWAEDSALVQTLQEWRTQTYGSDLAASIEALLTTNIPGMDFSVVADAEDFIADFYTTHPIDGSGDPTEMGDLTNLVTNMVNICLMWGNPGMALLAYIVGFDSVIQEEDVEDEDEDEIIDGIFGTADEEEGEVVDYIKYDGLGDVVKDLQGEAIEIIEDGGEALDDLIDDLRDLDPEDAEVQADQQEIQIKIDNVKTVMSTMTEFIKEAQEILDSMLEAAASLSEKQARTWGSIVNKI